MYLALFLVILCSCLNSNKDSIWPADMKWNELKQVRLRTKDESFDITKKSNDIYWNTSPSQYPYERERFNNWINELSYVGLLKSSKKNFSIINIKPYYLMLVFENETYNIEGYPHEDICFIKLQNIIKKISKAGYLGSEDCKRLFNFSQTLRNTHFELKQAREVYYVSSKKEHQLNSGQVEKLYKLFSLDVDKYLFLGEVDEGVLNRFKINQAINENIKGYFKVVDSTGTRKLYLGRPDERIPKIRIWLSGSYEIQEVDKFDWPSLKRIEEEVLND